MKAPFDIDIALARIADVVRPFPKAAMFELADDGFGSPFEQLVACIISIRTRDEVSLPTAKRLFGRARTPAAVAALTPVEIEDLIGAATFHGPKSATIHAIARRVTDDFGGELPCDANVMQSFSGVGPKCANLALGIACGQPRIAVDIHVHRVTNRWGYVHARDPEGTLAVLSEQLPERYAVTINRLLVPFGKHVCVGKRPYCSACPVLDMCQQVGVTDPR